MTDERPEPVPLPFPPPYNVYAVILQRLEAIQNKQKLQSDLLEALANAVTQLAAEDETDYTTEEAGIVQIWALLTTPPKPALVAAFKLEVLGANMAKATKMGKLKINLNPNGTATATISGVVDSFGNPTTFLAPPTYVCEVTVGAGQDPNVVLTPSADGMTCGIAAGTVIVAGDTLTALGDGISESYSPVSVVAGPANSFVISVA
jgi:hypothetical protein